MSDLSVRKSGPKRALIKRAEVPSETSAVTFSDLLCPALLRGFTNSIGNRECVATGKCFRQGGGSERD